MHGREFVRRARRYARKNGVDFDFDPSKGKGSHGQIRMGNRRTTVPHSEINPRTLASMLRDLGIDRRDF